MACKITKHTKRLGDYIKMYGQEEGLRHYEEEKVFLDKNSIRKGRVYSTLARNMALKRVSEYNNKYGYSHTVDFTPISPTSFKVNSVFIRMIPVNPEQKLERQEIRSEVDKTFSNVEKNKINITIEDEQTILNKFLYDKLHKLFPEITIDYSDLEGKRGEAHLNSLSIIIDTASQLEDTLPHEFAHNYIAWFRNTPIVKEAINKWGSEEKLVQAIGEQIVIQKGEALTWWQEFSKWIKTLFENITNRSKEELKNIITDAFLLRINPETGEFIKNVEQFRGRYKEIWNQSEISKINNEGSKKILKTLQESLRDSLVKLNRRRKILESQGKDKPAKDYKDLIERVLKDYKEEQYLEGISTYLLLANEEFTKLQDKLNDFYANPEDASVIKNMGNYISSHKDILASLNQAVRDYSFKEKSKEEKDKILNQISILSSTIQHLQNHYLQLGIESTSIFLDEFGWYKTKEALINELKNPNIDISWAQTWFNSMATANNDILKLIAKSVSDTKELARLKTLNLQKDLIKLKKDLESKGINNTSWMAESFDGKLSGNFVTERDWASFMEGKHKIFKKFKDKFGVEYREYKRDKKILENLSKEDLRWIVSFKKELSNFLYDHVLGQNESKALLDKMEKSLSTKEFERWRTLNVKYDSVSDKFIIPRKYNAQYESIVNNPDKLNFYNIIMDLNIDLQKSFPEKFKHPRRMPQIRKDFIERIKSGDLKGTLNDLKEYYKVMEDEAQRGTEFGLLDEKGNLVSFLPIFFTNRLKDTKHLSTDVVSTMLAFANMANDREAMSRIIDNLELAGDVLSNQKSYKLSPKGKLIKFVSKVGDEKLEEYHVNKEVSNVHKRFMNFMDMVVYGKQHIQGPEIAGVDREKAIDALSRYTAINQLAVNIYAGINNVLVGKAMLRVEAAAKEYFSYSDLLYADKIYSSQLPGLIGDIGSRLPQNKMSLWLEKHNTLENYSEEIANLDVERKNIFARLFQSSSLFFLSRIGEHYIHGKGSMALANQFKYSKEKGRFVTVKQFFKPVRELDEQRISEITKLKEESINKKWDKSTLNSKVKEININYKSKIQELNSKLSSQWKEMTNYWEAHEVKDNKLVLKEDFSNEFNDKDHLIFINLQHSINQDLNGNYGPDKAAIQKYALGRMAMMFHKWIKPYWDRRYKKWQYDFKKGDFSEGYYNTIGKFTAQLIRDLKKGQMSLYANWSTLSEVEKANFKRAMSEVSYMVGIAVLATIAMSIKGDDDDDWALNMMAYQANRLWAEVGVMIPGPTMVTEFMKLVREPIAGVSAIDDVIQALQFWNWLEEIERGKYEGMTKFQRSLIKTIPLAKTINDYSYPEEKIVFYNTFK